jgi:U3 small nucleolar RNA-associated protein 20
MVVPLRKQLGFLRMLALVVSVLGPLVQPQLRTFVSLLLGLAHHHRTILDHSRQEIQPVFVGVVKNLRQLVVTRLIECFKTFTTYDFSPFDDRIFESIVWPQLLKLPHESIQHPTPLMKLLITWSKFPRYHRLLNRTVPENLLPCSPQGSNISAGGPKFSSGGPTSILHHVYQCLFSAGVSERVTGSILQMTLDLLESGEREGGTGGEGVGLVLCHLPTLLAYLSGRVRERGERTADKEGGNLQLEFNVLSRISNHVKDPVECGALASLLMPFISAAKHKKQQESILVTLKNLLTSAEVVNSFFR